MESNSVHDNAKLAPARSDRPRVTRGSEKDLFAAFVVNISDVEPRERKPALPRDKKVDRAEKVPHPDAPRQPRREAAETHTVEKPEQKEKTPKAEENQPAAVLTSAHRKEMEAVPETSQAPALVANGSIEADVEVEAEVEAGNAPANPEVGVIEITPAETPEVILANDPEDMRVDAILAEVPANDAAVMVPPSVKDKVPVDLLVPLTPQVEVIQVALVPPAPQTEAQDMPAIDAEILLHATLAANNEEGRKVDQLMLAMDNKLAAAPKASTKALEKTAPFSAVGILATALGGAEKEAVAAAETPADVFMQATPDAGEATPKEGQSAASALKPDQKVIDLSQFAAVGRQASPLLPGQAPQGTNNGLSQHAPIPGKAGGPAAATLSNGVDVIARPLTLLAQQAEAANVRQARLQRLPANTLTQVQEQVAIKLRYAAKAGEKSLSIQLRPEELGRVDVKLDFREGNQVSAKVTADNQFTFDLLQRDRSALERALADAGLKLDANGLQFELRDSGSQNGQPMGNGSSEGAADEWANADDDIQLVETLSAETGGITADGRVNMIV
ncbi:MAG: flagellar hook-length control protein FliK [Bdellovibrionales bacterium]